MHIIIILFSLLNKNLFGNILFFYNLFLLVPTINLLVFEYIDGQKNSEKSSATLDFEIIYTIRQ